MLKAVPNRIAKLYCTGNYLAENGGTTLTTSFTFNGRIGFRKFRGGRNVFGFHVIRIPKIFIWAPCLRHFASIDFYVLQVSDYWN